MSDVSYTLQCFVGYYWCSIMIITKLPLFRTLLTYTSLNHRYDFSELKIKRLQKKKVRKDSRNIYPKFECELFFSWLQLSQGFNHHGLPNFYSAIIFRVASKKSCYLTHGSCFARKYRGKRFTRFLWIRIESAYQTDWPEAEHRRLTGPKILLSLTR